MWGLSGLKLLDLSHNRLTNVVEQNFEGLYSLKELCLAHNQVRLTLRVHWDTHTYNQSIAGH
jgi:Leucine-rich repeat (LRR) protein